MTNLDCVHQGRMAHLAGPHGSGKVGLGPLHSAVKCELGHAEDLARDVNNAFLPRRVSLTVRKKP